MKTIFSVINSDAVNRKNMKFTAGSFGHVLNDKWLEGMLVNIGHDIHKPLGWGRPFGVYLEPGLTRLLGLTYIPESKEEKDHINNARLNLLIQHYESACTPYISVFEEIINKYGTFEDVKYLNLSCVTANSKNIASIIFKNIFEKRDKDGLIDIKVILKEFSIIGPGYFKHNDSELILMAHRKLRHSFSILNNYNVEFLDKLFSLKDKNNLNIKILLDDSIIGFSKNYQNSIELEYWRGPKFNNDIDNMKTGVTVHSTKVDDYQKVFHNIYKTEFWFKKDDNLRIFEIEELRDYPCNDMGTEYYGNRYIHSIYNVDKKMFEHFDGAVKMYSDEEYLERCEKDIKSAGKHARYLKLFRIDGELEINQWKSLISDYFRGNPLIGEYFHGEKDEPRFQPHTLTINPDKNIIYKKCPYKIDKNDGIRLLLSFYPILEKTNSYDRMIINMDTITTNEDSYNVIEFNTIEVKKSLNRLQKDLNIPENVKLLVTEDLYLNLPLIRHGTENYPNNVKDTIIAISKIITKLEERKKEYVIIINISWIIENKEVRLSIFGHINDLLHWLNEFKESIPLNNDDFSIWIEKNSKWLSTNYKESNDMPALSEIAKNSGLIWIHRKQLEENETVRLYYDEKGNQVYEIDMPSQNEEDFKILCDKIEPCRSFFINKSRCSKCGGNYFICKHSEFLDEDVCEIVEDYEPITLFWSDKKALKKYL